MTTYSILKLMMALRHNINIGNYSKLLQYLNVLSAEQIETFLKEAPDSRYLVHKVAIILGVNGCCSMSELTYLTVDKFKKLWDELMAVTVKGHFTNNHKSFGIHDEHVKIVERYMELRRPVIKTNRFFLNYQKGKCMAQPIGINKLGNVPREIAGYLKLPNPDQYTGHCFRRSSAALEVSRIWRHKKYQP